MSFKLILNSLWTVVPPTLFAAVPVSAFTKMLLSSWKIFHMHETKEFVSTLIPVPTDPNTVRRSGLNHYFLVLLLLKG